MTSAAPRIWFDVGFLISHFSRDRQANGIQRVGIELARAMRQVSGEQVTLCRLATTPFAARFERVDFERLEAAYAGAEFLSPGWPRVAAWLAKAGRTIVSGIAKIASSGGTVPITPPGMKRGDVLLCLGTDWTDPIYRSWVAAARQTIGLRFAVMIHDVIPYSDPALASPVFVREFTGGFSAALAICDLVLVSSEFSAAAIASLCRDRGWPVPPLARIRFGDGFAVPMPASKTSAAILPPSFVLFVSSIEGLRKNHVLLVRVWRRLLTNHRAESMPSLVFLGTGHLVDAVAVALRESAELRGKIVPIADASEELLRAAYRSCLFTVYPSLIEGWGLPVAESLTFGKFCVASNRASLPEVAGDLVDYFDPADEDDAHAKIERAIFDTAYRLARETRIAAEYRPVSWHACAEALFAALSGAGSG